MKNEKHVESELTSLLTKDFDDSYIYYDPRHHPLLKQWFKKASKQGEGCGIPDRIYFDECVCIIFECKYEKLTKAQKDVRHYLNCIRDNKHTYTFFGVAFVSSIEYTIYQYSHLKITLLENCIIHPTTFGIVSTQMKINIQKEIHIIHNYIRDYTKISNEDKPLFIAMILIGLRNDVFLSVIENAQKKENLYTVLETIIQEYDMDINVFKPLISNEDKKHIYHLIIAIKKIYDQHPSIDLLNEFYNEFIQYNNTDSKSLGIVLTPPHIVSLMVDLLDIQPDDILLDLCTGTGSFLLEAAKYHPKKLIGCEYQNKLFALLQCNMIIRNITSYEVIKGNCFQQTFQATKSIINPPYSVKNEPEYEFILKQIESIIFNGLTIAIIPFGKLTNTSSNNRYKKRILEVAYVKTIIICRKSLFYPSASIQCCILLLQKKGKEEDVPIRTNIINYEDDGFIVKRHAGIVKTPTYESHLSMLKEKLNDTSKGVLLQYNDNWTKETEEENDTTSEIDDTLSAKLYALELEYLNKKRNILQSYVPITSTIYKEFIIHEVFKVENINTPLQLNKSFDKGEYPLISASKIQNGIQRYIEKQSHEPMKGHCLTFSTVGTCFYQEHDFYATSSIKILRPTIEVTMTQLIYISTILRNKYLEKYNKNRGFKYEVFKDLKVHYQLK